MSNASSPRLAKSAKAIHPSVGEGALGRLFFASLVLLFVVTASGGSLAADTEERLAGVVNLNTASIEELKLLPGVGEARAEAIVTLRNELGGFTTVDELMVVKGLGPNLMKRLRPHVTLEGETTAAMR